MDLSATAEFLEIECPKCGTEFRIPTKYCGENALCDTCGVLFQIPTYDDLRNAEEVNLPDDIPEPEVTDNTVKIERKSIGMIPDADVQNVIDTSNFMIPEKETQRKKRRVFRI